MQTMKITETDIKNHKYTNGVVDFDGHVEIASYLGIVFFEKLTATGRIVAGIGTGIKAGTGIEAGEGIEAGWEIEAGTGIKAGANISVKRRIFAGMVMWRKPSQYEMKIKCRQLESGEVAYGNLIETGDKVN